MKKIGIIGCGWLGLRLATKLSEQFEIHTTTTTYEKKESLSAKGFNPTIASFEDYQLPEKKQQWDVMQTLEAIIITVPFSEKTCCVSSLYNRAEHLAAFMGNFSGQIFLMSSTGVYPDLAKEFREDDLLPDHVLGERIIKNKYPQTNILRLAGLMGDARLLCNYRISNLDFAVNHIHYADIAQIINTMIEKQLQATVYNITAPLHPTKMAVINAQKNLPEIPEVKAKGKIISSEKLVHELNYHFLYPDPRYFHL